MERFSCRLGRLTAAHNCIFGLLGEKVGVSLPPIAMVPEARLVLWIQLETQVKPTEADLEGLTAEPEEFITAPEEVEITGARTMVEAQKLVMVPKAWAPYFLEPQLPWEELYVFKILMRNIPSNIKDSFEFIETWLRITCMKATETEESVVRAKCQNPHANRNVLGWMLHHTLFLNSMSLAPVPQSSDSLEPQECLNKALETVDALKPEYKAKKYNHAYLCHLRATCSLTEAKMMTSLPNFHKNLLSEERTKRGAEVVLMQELHPDKNSNNPGLIYVSPKLVKDIKDCKYGLGWDMSYKEYQRRLPPFTVPPMSLFHQQERKAYQDHRWELPFLRYHGIRGNYHYPFWGVNFR